MRERVQQSLWSCRSRRCSRPITPVDLCQLTPSLEDVQSEQPTKTIRFYIGSWSKRSSYTDLTITHVRTRQSFLPADLEVIISEISRKGNCLRTRLYHISAVIISSLTDVTPSVKCAAAPAKTLRGARSTSYPPTCWNVCFVSTCTIQPHRETCVGLQ